MATTSSVYVSTGGDGKISEVVLVERTEEDGKSTSTKRKLGVVLEAQPGVFSALLSGVVIEGVDAIKATSVSEVADKLQQALVAGSVQFNGASLTAPASIPEAAAPEPAPSEPPPAAS